MTKIGILTYHNNSRNIGSILQAYCLYWTLKENNIGDNIEIIDYRTFSKEIKRIWSHDPSIFIPKILDFFTFERFFHSYNALSYEKIVTDDYTKAINFIKNLNYDMVIVGSDTVWRLDEGRFARPFPNAYFLDPNLECIKVSYAASSSLTDYSNLSEKKIRLIKKLLSSFDRISVRDKHTENFLKKLDISNYRRVPDPTILVNLPKKDLTSILKSNGISIEKPILNINQCGKFSKKIAEHFRDKGYQIVCSQKSKYSDFDMWRKINPIDYYSIHRHFDLVISGSLHSTIFSIKNNTPFATLDFSPPHLIDKKETLLEEFSLLNRHIEISNEDPTMEVLDKIEKCEKKLNEKQVKNKVNVFRKKGQRYIKELEDLFYEKNV